MDTDRREQVRRSLVILAESQRANLAALAQALSLLGEELPSAAPPPACRHSRPPSSPTPPGLAMDHEALTVRFGGRTCFLGNTLPSRLLARLAQRPGRYFSYDELLDEVCEGCRRPDALRAGKRVGIGGHFRRSDLEFDVTAGAVSRPVTEGGGRKWIQHDAAIRGGNSGGPLLAEGGTVVGINTLEHAKAAGVQWSLSMPQLKGEIDGHAPGAVWK